MPGSASGLDIVRKDRADTTFTCTAGVTNRDQKHGIVVPRINAIKKEQGRMVKSNFPVDSGPISLRILILHFKISAHIFFPV